MFTRRFGGLPALKVGVIYIVWFGHKSKWKLSFHAAENVTTKNGICDLTALNLGQFLVMREVIRTPPSEIVTAIRSYLANSKLREVSENGIISLA